jgi:ABC-type sugar transport system ATPase subunit
MGRAVVRRPKVFLFDEPLSNLDASLRAQMRVELKRLHQRLSATMIYVTHDQVEAMTLADRIAVLNGGTLMQVGPPGELYERPANVFVAGFLGTPEMNLIPAAHAPALLAPLPAAATQFGLRAEDLLLGAEGALARVEVVEPLGWESLLHLRLCGTGGAERGEALLIARTAAGAAPRVGTEVRVRSREGKVHSFDADGQRVADVLRATA